MHYFHNLFVFIYLIFNYLFVLKGRLIISILIIGFENIIGMAIPEIGYGPLTPLYSLFVLIPSLAVVVRRLHDVGKSGWMFLILLIPIVGFIWILVLLLTDSQQESNNWGDNPKLEEWI